MAHRISVPLLALVGCTSSKTPTPDSAPADTGFSPPTESATGLSQLEALGVRNLIVVHSDTLRADVLPMYDYERLTTPNLASIPYLAVRGWRAAAPWTMPSTVTALTGLRPEVHGALTMAGVNGEDVASTLAERLQAAGFATALASGNKVVANDALMLRGFDQRVAMADLEGVESQQAAALWGHAQTMLEGLGEDEPFFLWMQAMDTHTPYHPFDPFLGTYADYDQVPFAVGDDTFEQLEQFQTAYAAAATDDERAAIVAAVRDVYDELVLQQDHTLGQIFDWLESAGHLEDTLVVVTADHGETIADDGTASIGHSSTVRPELVDLPMLFYHPSLDAAWTRCLGSNTDLAPTLLEILGVEALDGIDGQSVLDGCRDLVYSSLYNPDSDENTLMWLSVMNESTKLDWNCLNGLASLYDLEADPQALRELDLADAPELEPLWGALEEYFADAQARHPELVCAIEPPPAVAARPRGRVPGGIGAQKPATTLRAGAPTDILPR